MISMPLDFIKDPRDMLKALLDSKDRGTAIGIKCPVLGKGVFVTGVDDILLGDGHENTRIVLKGYDFTGLVLETNIISFGDIEAICQFTSKFGNPILKTLRRILNL